MARTNPKPLPDTMRSRLLQQAMEITHHDRNANYGNPEDNFQHIANFWNNFLAVSNRTADLTSADVASFMILMKMARLGNNPNHIDSILDVAGYAACLAECQEQITV